MTVFSRTDTSLLSDWWWTVDRWLLMALALLIGLGIVMTFSASPAIAEKLGLGSFHFVKRQILFIIAAMIAMIGVSLLPVQWVKRLGVTLFLAAVILMVLTMVIGFEAKGSRRWLSIGSFTLQASEFLKPAFIIFSAWMFSEVHKTPEFRGWSIAIFSYLIVVALLISQPDFGQTILVSLVWGAQFFMAGLPMIWVLGLAGLGMAGVFLAYMLIPHVSDRIDRFLYPEISDTYQVDTALNALRSGGIFGRGPGEGAVKKILPERFTRPQTVFLNNVPKRGKGIAVGHEAFGGIKETKAGFRMFVFLAVSGLIIQFGLQAFINLGVNLSVLPSKGMTLPFISYGGSSMLSMAIAMGMVLALTRRGAGNNLENLNSGWRKS